MKKEIGFTLVVKKRDGGGIEMESWNSGIEDYLHDSGFWESKNVYTINYDVYTYYYYCHKYGRLDIVDLADEFDTEDKTLVFSGENGFEFIEAN